MESGRENGGRLSVIRKFVKDSLDLGERACSNDDFEKLVKLFAKYTSETPKKSFCCKSSDSYGFYRCYIKMTKYEAQPKPFFKILNIDANIGWTNPAHVVETVFTWKAVNIIDDENVSLIIIFTPKFFYAKIFFGQKFFTPHSFTPKIFYKKIFVCQKRCQQHNYSELE